MELVLSRHAERRADIYNIKYDDILRIVDKAIEEEPDKNRICFQVEGLPSGMRKYPLRVVFRFVNPEKIILISVHPLRKGKKK